jgi:hypothetical protein
LHLFVTFHTTSGLLSVVNWSICGGTPLHVSSWRIASDTVAVPHKSFVNPIIVSRSCDGIPDRLFYL